MRRSAVVSIVGGLILFVLAPVGAAQLPDARVEPRSGPAGTTVTISVSVYSPNTEIFVYEGGDDSGTLLGSGMTGPGGTGSFPITIPVDAPEGSYLMYICGLCDAQFPEWATRGFTVTDSPGTTTTTTAVTTTTAAASTTESPVTTAGETTTSAADSGASTTETQAQTTTTIAAGAPDTGGDDSGGMLLGILLGVGIGGALFAAWALGKRTAPSRRGSRPPPPPPAR